MRLFATLLRQIRAGRPAGGGGADGVLGARGEEAAERMLRRAGYAILKRNLRSRAGEIDLIARDPDGRTIVFIEVKTRAGAGARGLTPETRVGAEKRARLLMLARTTARRAGWERLPLRIDVIGVDLPEGERGGEPVIRHHRAAVTG